MSKPDPNTTYYVCPGNVISRSDGDRHFIGGRKLCQLYGLRPTADNVRILNIHDRAVRPRKGDNTVFLHPRSDGDYTLPEP